MIISGTCANHVRSLLLVLYPDISPPLFTGPNNVNTEPYNSRIGDSKKNKVTDFTFQCSIQYKAVTERDVAMFDVVLTFDDVPDRSTLKTTTAKNKIVVFNSADVQNQFGKNVSNANVF